MALKVYDRVKENTSTTGVGGLSLTGSPNGFQRFSDVLSSGDTTYYALEENDKWEVGIGTYGSDNLERTTVLTSSSGGSKISLGGSGSVFITYPAEKSAFITDVTSVSGIAAYASGLAESGGGDVTTAQLQYVSGIAVYGSGQASNIATNTSNISTNTSNISTNSSNIVATSGIANYASGIAGQNESDVIAVSGIANYASGGSNFTAGSGLTLVGSEFNMSGTGRLQELQIKSSSSTPQIVFTGSGAVSSINAKAKTNDGSFSPSGTSISFEGSEGQLLNITDNLSSGNIFSVSNISGLPLLEIDASGDVKIARRGRYVGVGSGVPEYGLDVSASGRIQKGVVLSNYVPAVTTNTLYNDGGTISWNGSALGGDVSSSELTYVSGIAVYASGKANDVSDVANSNQSSISTNQTNITAISGVAYNTFSISASDSNNYTINGMGFNNALDPDIYLHKGHTYYFNKLSVSHPFRISASDGGAVYQDADGNNIEISGQGNLKFEVPQDAPDKLYYYCTSHSSAMKGEIYTTNNVDELTYASGIAAYASGQAIANEGDLVAVSGIAAYASGAAGGGGDVTTAQLNYVSGIAVYSSGLAITNEAEATYASGLAITNEGRVNYASGQAIANESDIVATSGISAYASGLAITNEGRVNYASGQVNVTTDGTAEGSKALVLDSAKSFTGVKDGRFSQFDSFVYSTGVSIGNSGVLLSRNTPDVTTDTLYNVGGTLYFNGSQLASAGGASAEAQYASGQAIENESDIVAVSGIAAYASGHVHDDLYVSGIATYASGQAIANESDIATNTSNISTNTSNISTNTGRVNYASGQAIQNEIDIAYVSGAAVYASGNTITTQAIANYASGQAIENEGLVTYASGNTANISFGSNAEGDMLFHNGTTFVRLAKGADDYILKMNGNQPNWEEDTGGGGDVTTAQLVYVSGIAVYSSGQVDVTTDGTAEASKALILDSAKSFTGVKDGRFSQFDSFVYSSGVNVGNSGVLLSRNTPDVTTDTLYNVGGTLYFNGSQLASAGGASAEAQYASGQAIENESDIAALLTASGTATSLISSSGIASYASGQAIANESDIATNTSNISTNTARVSYASGQAIANESDIAALLTASGTATSLIASSGIATYASGQAIANETDIATNTSNISTNTSNISTNTARVNYASGQAIQNETDIAYTSGIATYASGNTIVNDGLIAYASGNTANILFGSNAEGDILIHNGSKFTRLARGTDNYILKMNGNLPNWEAESAGSSLTAGSGITIDGDDKINVYGGSGHFINLEVNGAFTATTKSFLIDHPSKQGMKLQYASLEGPENGVYVRGTTDQGFITLPDYWKDLVDNDSMTVTLTPVGQFQPLFVEEKSNREIRVGGVCGYYDYVVYGERKDVNKLEVEW